MSRHPVDVLSLGAGVIFTVFALGYLIAPAAMNLVVVIPLMLIGLGIVGILAAVVAQSRRQDAPGSM